MDISTFSLYDESMRCVVLWFPFYRWWNWSWWRWSSLPKTTRLAISGRVRRWTQLFWLQRGNFSKTHNERGIFCSLLLKKVLWRHRGELSSSGWDGTGKVLDKSDLTRWGDGMALQVEGTAGAERVEKQSCIWDLYMWLWVIDWE